MIAEANLPLDRLTTLCAQMTKATNDFRRCINEAKELHVRQIEKMQQERDAALLAARVHEDADDPNHMNQMPGMEMPPSKKVNNLTISGSLFILYFLHILYFLLLFYVVLYFTDFLYVFLFWVFYLHECTRNCCIKCQSRENRKRIKRALGIL